MTKFEAEPILARLTDFQRRTVDHVSRQLYDPRGSGRFLVADETGLGKSMVARGVIAKTIERLQDDDGVKRIDIVYVCANADLAQQNLKRLNVTGEKAKSFASRLTMLALHTGAFANNVEVGKPVNLVSFTPGTSFDMGYSTGTARERAMLFLILCDIYQFTRAQRTALKRILQGQVRQLSSFDSTIYGLRWDLEQSGGIDSVIRDQFDAELEGGDSSLDERIAELVDIVTGRSSVPKALADEPPRLVRALRRALAKASVESLEPDLVILDEFQRFRHLLAKDTEAGQLAHELFDHTAAKVLLLSATPYKPFTYAEEVGEDHAKEFHKTIEFLGDRHADFDVTSLTESLARYRSAVVRRNGQEAGTAAIRSHLLKVMSRSERPKIEDNIARRELVRPTSPVTAEDLSGYAALHRVARAVQQPKDSGLITPEYWKSAPYFANFCDTYKLGERIKAAWELGQPVTELETTQRLRRPELEEFRALEGGNAKMRDLIAHTVGSGQWKLLWIPPSMPYLEPAGAYEGVEPVTKTLVFSSWTATPTAVASILSFEAERRAAEGSTYTRYTADSRKRQTRPLGYSLRGSQPAEMTTLLMAWPMPDVALAVDPLDLVAENGGELVPQHIALNAARDRLAMMLSQVSSDQSQPTEGAPTDLLWESVFSQRAAWPTVDPSPQDLRSYGDAMAGQQDDGAGDGEDEPSPATGLAAHIQAAADAFGAGPRGLDNDQLQSLAAIALHSPANIAFRALTRVIAEEDQVTDKAVFEAAATIANGLRSLFNRPDVTKLLEQVTDEGYYWQRVLTYCGGGNLQATMDEYLHHFRHDQYPAPLTEKSLTEFAGIVSASISLRTSTYQAMDPEDVQSPLTFVPRFALRYGGRKHEAESARQPEVRRSFNSPFWPFVLASTSVGQEGIDFHWWSHAVFHWNVPPNPVDFEQREGRVDRYRGHAIRRNIAAKHSRAVLADPGRDPWERAFRLAKDYTEEYGDFAPNWVYPGPAKIERHIATFPLSSDLQRYSQVKRDVALYRLTFGQPRQEDMLELIQSRDGGLPIDQEDLPRIDLSP